MLNAELNGTQRTIAGLDELGTLVGATLGHSGWVTVTQELVDGFADATGDHQWIHVDTDRAAGGPFGTTVAHGYLTVSLLPVLLKQAYQVTGLSMAVNYGSDRVRFPAPVPVGSRIRARADLLELTPRDRGMLARTHVQIDIEGRDRPGCTAVILSLLIP